MQHPCRVIAKERSDCGNPIARDHHVGLRPPRDDNVKGFRKHVIPDEATRRSGVQILRSLDYHLCGNDDGIRSHAITRRSRALSAKKHGQVSEIIFRRKMISDTVRQHRSGVRKTRHCEVALRLWQSHGLKSPAVRAPTTQSRQLYL